jgi:hypothetical protein
VSWQGEELANAGAAGRSQPEEQQRWDAAGLFVALLIAQVLLPWQLWAVAPVDGPQVPWVTILSMPPCALAAAAAATHVAAELCGCGLR